jgi:UDP-N-acetylmuramate--alanine ligase
MSAIARVLLERGERVSGSDLLLSGFAQALLAAGAAVAVGHRAANVAGADLVIASSAVPEDNPELVAARRDGIPVLRRAEFLGELVEGYRTVAVAGTHGKTTTAGMIAWVLRQTGRSPSFIVGGELQNLGTNAASGRGPHFVIEADEYDRTFLGLHPQLAVVTNVDHDHPDCYPTPADFQAAFEAFAAQVTERLVLCADDPGAAALAAAAPSRAARTTYGLDPAADWRAEEVKPNQAGGTDFLVLSGRATAGLARLRIPGLHNVRNALAALAVTELLGVPLDDALVALTEFLGVGRRFQVLGEAGGVTVIDDYAHHPAEIRATLAAARQRYPGQAIWAVYQPHTYSRPKALLAELALAFADADRVTVTEVYASREAPVPDFGGREIASAIQHKHAEFVPDLEGAAEHILQQLKGGTVLITLSAGDGNLVGRLVLDGLTPAEEGASHVH